jgi:hypothetical protein
VSSGVVNFSVAVSEMEFRRRVCDARA